MQVIDMIWDAATADVVDVSRSGVELELRDVDNRHDVFELVAREHAVFTEFYENAPTSTRVFAVTKDGDLVGAVLTEDLPRAAESSKDGALGCLVIREEFNGQGIGSAAIVLCCRLLAARGFDRVIAEWVASVSLYERLGFKIWKQREIDL